MKKLSVLKLVCSVLAVSILMLTVSVFGADSTDENLAKTVDESILMQEESLGFLDAAGFINSYDDGTYKLDKAITRADLAVYAVRMLGESEKERTENTYFGDVPNYHWAASSIEKLLARGVISSGAEYRPDDYATVIEVAKVMVHLTGYGNLAQGKGGYPIGYLDVARQIGISIDGNINALCTREKAFRMMYDALNANVLEQIIFSNEGGSFVEGESTLLSLYHDIYSFKGRVNGACGISLTQNNSLENDEIIVGNILIGNVNMVDAEDYLGREVICYYHEDNNESYSMVYLYADDETVEINADDIVGYGSGVLTYYDKNDHKRTVSGLERAVVVRNGESVSTGVSQAFNIEYGTITLIGESLNEVAIIKEVETIVCGSIDVDKSIVYDDYGITEPLELSPNSVKTVKLYQEGGTQIDVSSLKRGDLLSVVRSDEYVNVCVSTTEVNVKIDSFGVKNRYVELTAGGKEYNVLKNVYEQKKQYIKPGAEVILQFNSMGIVAGIRQGAELISNKWGYVIGISGETSLETTVKVRLYTYNKELSVIEFDDKLTVDGKRYRMSDNDDVAELKTLLSVPQLIVYKTNNDGKITFIDSPERGVNEGSNTLTRTLEMGLHKFSPWIAFGSLNFVTTDTVVLSIPPQDDLSSAVDKDFNIQPIKSAITWSWPRDFMCEAYRFDGDKLVDNVVVMDDFSNMTMVLNAGVNDMMIVREIYTSLSDDGETETIVELVNRSGETMTYSMYRDTEMKDSRAETGNKPVEIGDCILARLQGGTKISEINIIYDASEQKWMGTLDDSADPRLGNESAGLRISKGYINRIGDGFATWSFTQGGEEVEGGALNNIGIVVCRKNAQNGKYDISKGNEQSLKAYKDAGSDCSKVIAQARDGLVRTLIVYEEN